MASLNASAMLAATYEVERHMDRVDSMYDNRHLSVDSDVPTVPKKLKDIKDEVLDAKEVSAEGSGGQKVYSIVLLQTKPVATNVVIVQDTDVTITGVYVNSTLGSSQEAYCKMQYRVQSSVTEERLVRPAPLEPPKSYTPLGALSCMLPPGTDSGEFARANVSLRSFPLSFPHFVLRLEGIPEAHSLQLPSSSSSVPPLIHQPSPDCDSPYRYPPMYPPVPPPPLQPQPHHPQHLLQPPTPSIHHSSSAFCALPPQAHHDPSGKSLPTINSIQSQLARASLNPSPAYERGDEKIRNNHVNARNLAHKSRRYLTLNTRASCVSPPSADNHLSQLRRNVTNRKV